MNLHTKIDSLSKQLRQRISDRTRQQFATALVSPLMLLAATAPAHAATTGLTGGNQPIDNLQPSLALNYIIATQGVFPFQGGSGCGLGNSCIGQISTFAGNFAPTGWEFTNGQLLPISGNTALFSLLGTTYGGNGTTTFALPNLGGRTPIGTGTGTGLSARNLGAPVGTQTVTLTESQLPSHTHTLTGSTGGNQPVNNVQPSLPLTYAIAIQGVFGSCRGSSTCLGEIGKFAFGNNSLPGNWLPADGRLLSISENQALFAILGTTYGGNGTTNFALPDLQGRTAIGTGTGAGLSTRNLGDKIGSETVTLTEAQLASHTHPLPETPDLTGATGGNQPINNIQPSLALTYAIATEGIFPARGGNSISCSDEACIGEVGLFAFSDNFLNNNVRGWLPADGRLLSIFQNQALFSLLGTSYGGDGRTTFALPDLRGRTPIGPGFGGNLNLGQIDGIESNVLSIAQLPSHNHPIIDVPEPLTIIGTIIGGTAAMRLRKKLNSTGEE